MERRTFLKGALVAATTPVVVLAPELPATLGALIMQHSFIVEQQNEADRLVNAAFKHPGMPEEGVCAGEIDPNNWLKGQSGSRFYYAHQIDQYFDDLEHNANCMKDARGMDVSSYRNRIAQIAERRPAAKNLLVEREAAYAAWREASGIEPLEIEADRLAGLESDLDDQILVWRCETMDDVRLKARHIAACYGDNLAQTSLNEVIKSFLI
jgi:hypothetical protein